jgi:xanthosine utilization system XapX-like protein
MKAVGLVLVILGVVGLLYGGIRYTYKDKVVDAGPIQITRDKHESIPLPPIAGGIMLVAGVALLLKPSHS